MTMGTGSERLVHKLENMLASDTGATSRAIGRFSPRKSRARRHQHLDFGFPASRAVRDYVSVVSHHPVCATLLWWSQETNRQGNN